MSVIKLSDILVKDEEGIDLATALFFAHEGLCNVYHLGPVDQDGFCKVIRENGLGIEVKTMPPSFTHLDNLTQ